MGIQSRGNPNLGNFETPTWESRDKKSFGCGPCGKVQSILYGGRWWLPPSPGCGESYVSVLLVVRPSTKSAPVAKSEGPAHTLPTTNPACIVLIVRSLIDRHLFPLRLQPAHCSTADLFVFEDLQTIKHMTGHSTAHNVFSHICIKQLFISFTRYIHTPTTQACPFKNTSLIVSGILISLLPPLSSSILLQLELSYLSDAAEDQKQQKLLATEYFSPLFPFVFSPNSFPTTLLLSLLSDLYLFLRCRSLPSPPLFLQQSSDLLLPTSVASSRSFSKSLSAVPIRFPIRRHIKQTPSMSAAMQNPLSSIPFKKINNSSCRIKAKAAAMQQTA